MGRAQLAKLHDGDTRPRTLSIQIIDSSYQGVVGEFKGRGPIMITPGLFLILDGYGLTPPTTWAMAFVLSRPAMFFAKTAIVVAVLAAFASPAACTPAETNGQRMARGLPPLPPVFKRNVPGRRDDHRGATPAWGWNPQPSARPPSTPTSTSGGLNLSNDIDLSVTFTVLSQSTAPFDVVATNPQFPAPFYVGAAGNLNVNSLDTTSQKLQSSALNFRFNSTSAIRDLYINPDGSSPVTVLVYDIRANSLFFVGDLDAYNANNDTPASAVNLYLVDADDNNSGHDNNGQGHNGDNNQGHGDNNNQGHGNNNDQGHGDNNQGQNGHH
ncbi:hypothetical protein H0H93_010155 [Arthromyces matolae]|nr:hypothetical protein H0H93_010155 [Arthromyces matolae]